MSKKVTAIKRALTALGHGDAIKDCRSNTVDGLLNTFAKNCSGGSEIIEFEYVGNVGEDEPSSDIGVWRPTVSEEEFRNILSNNPLAYLKVGDEFYQAMPHGDGQYSFVHFHTGVSATLNPPKVTLSVYVLDKINYNYERWAVYIRYISTQTN